MKVEVAKAAGFCFGVKRSIDLVEKALQEQKQVFLLKQPVHNPVVVNALIEKGAKIVQSLDEVPQGAVVVIRAHGEPLETFKQIKEKKIEQIVDCTCPFVQMVQKKARELEEQGFQVVIVGEKEHAEVLGIKGSTKSAIVVESKQEAEQLFKDKEQFFSTCEIAREKNSGEVIEKLYSSLLNKVGIVSQTTQTDENFAAIVSALAGKCRELKAFNTICSATHARQPAAVELAMQSDVMIIIGGKNSGNTQRLFELSKSACLDSYWVETAAELKKEWFEEKKSAGITAGASTPPESIEEVKKRVEKL